MTSPHPQAESHAPRTIQSSPRFGFGVDVGGSSLKAAVVDLHSGEFHGERLEVATPQPATPDAIAEAVAQLTRQAAWSGPVGIALPSVIVRNIARTAANIDPTWVGTDVVELFSTVLGHHDVTVLNDADAAGLAEVSFGCPEAQRGSALFLTFGTGIGSALLANGQLFANSELGHLLIDDTEAEHLASSAVRTREGLSYDDWAKRVETVLCEYERLLNPDVIIVGGGVSENSDQWVPLLNVNTPVVVAKLLNRAGIVGAAKAGAGHVAGSPHR
ncbi:polyphosphate glucokinase [Corynebacterium sp. HMSC08F01]|uniref:polyphosphate--glucose phosphotransferase n=1 Tax=Corynebacterium sp. HMSC08F01 TaxID=1581139 RepID=UPI0008A17FF5|nr:ROK family protein [Corynebacterium sp. HMSC08F01]OFT29471.1 polyphosphate glucokinase [Corynebacterium sp. HMSC08F01]